MSSVSLPSPLRDPSPQLSGELRLNDWDIEWVEDHVRVSGPNADHHFDVHTDAECSVQLSQAAGVEASFWRRLWERGPAKRSLLAELRIPNGPRIVLQAQVEGSLVEELPNLEGSGHGVDREPLLSLLSALENCGARFIYQRVEGGPMLVPPEEPAQEEAPSVGQRKMSGMLTGVLSVVFFFFFFFFFFGRGLE